MVAQESNENNTQQPPPPPPERVTLPDLYRRAYQRAEDCDSFEGDGIISALLAVAAEIRSLRVALTESQVPL